MVSYNMNTGRKPCTILLVCLPSTLVMCLSVRLVLFSETNYTTLSLPFYLFIFFLSIPFSVFSSVGFATVHIYIYKSQRTNGRLAGQMANQCDSKNEKVIADIRSTNVGYDVYLLYCYFISHIVVDVRPLLLSVSLSFISYCLAGNSVTHETICIEAKLQLTFLFYSLIASDIYFDIKY